MARNPHSSSSKKRNRKRQPPPQAPAELEPAAKRPGSFASNRIVSIAQSNRDVAAGCRLHHALGLALVRLKRQDEAITELHRAAELEPDRARYAYVYAVGLDASGHRSDAIEVLKDNLARYPEDRDTLFAL